MGFISLPQDQHEEEYVSKKHSIFCINKSSVAINVFMYRKATVKVKYQQDNLFWFSILANSTPQSHYLVCWEATLYLLRWFAMLVWHSAFLSSYLVLSCTYTISAVRHWASEWKPNPYPWVVPEESPHPHPRDCRRLLWKLSVSETSWWCPESDTESRPNQAGLEA